MPLAEQVTATGKLIEPVTRMPQRILDSIKADIGKAVTVELRSGKGEFEIREVSGATVNAMAVVGKGKMGRTFTFADLSPRERLKRLGTGDTPDLVVMRGILALEAERAETAGKLFAQAGGPLAEAFGRELERRSAAATDAQAEAELRDLLRAIAKSTASLEPEALIASIRAKCASADQVKRTRERVAAFAKTYGTSVAAKQYLPIVEKALAYPFPDTDWTAPDLGMEFVWIPAMEMWVGKYEVTNAEYRAYKPDHDSKNHHGYNLNADRQPVVYVNFDDAKAYAAWLSERERAAGRLPVGFHYRLPREDEWTTFAQCGDGREYPWGNDWPPKYGNYYGKEVPWAKEDETFRDYRDGFPVTCPVEQSGRNDWGLFGVGGNVFEGTATRQGDGFGAWRGACWDGGNQPAALRCIGRWIPGPKGAAQRDEVSGFRLALSR